MPERPLGMQFRILDSPNRSRVPKARTGPEYAEQSNGSGMRLVLQDGSFRQSGGLLWTSNSRALIARTPTKRTLDV